MKFILRSVAAAFKSELIRMLKKNLWYHPNDK